MRKRRVLVHTLLLVTSPSFFAYPHAETPHAIQQGHGYKIPYDSFNLTYDDVLHLLEDIESGKIEEYSEEKLERISQLLIFLAKQQLMNSSLFYQEVEATRWYYNNFSLKLGHHDIDREFSTDYAPLYVTTQTDFNTLAYQMRGEKALDRGYYSQAVLDFDKVIELNPSHLPSYLEI